MNNISSENKYIKKKTKNIVNHNMQFLKAKYEIEIYYNSILLKFYYSTDGYNIYNIIIIKKKLIK